MESNYYEHFDEAHVLSEIKSDQKIESKQKLSTKINTDTVRPASIKSTVIVSQSTMPNGTSSFHLCLILIALIIYKTRKEEHKGFDGLGVLLCILCCPQLYITYVLVNWFIN